MMAGLDQTPEEDQVLERVKIKELIQEQDQELEAHQTIEFNQDQVVKQEEEKWMDLGDNKIAISNTLRANNSNMLQISNSNKCLLPIRIGSKTLENTMMDTVNNIDLDQEYNSNKVKININNTLKVSSNNLIKASINKTLEINNSAKTTALQASVNNKCLTRSHNNTITINLKTC